MGVETRIHSEPITFFVCDQPGCGNNIAILSENEFPSESRELFWSIEWAEAEGGGWHFEYDYAGALIRNTKVLCPGHNPLNH